MTNTGLRIAHLLLGARRVYTCESLLQLVHCRDRRRTTIQPNSVGRVEERNREFLHDVVVGLISSPAIFSDEVHCGRVGLLPLVSTRLRIHPRARVGLQPSAAQGCATGDRRNCDSGHIGHKATRPPGHRTFELPAIATVSLSGNVLTTLRVPLARRAGGLTSLDADTSALRSAGKRPIVTSS